MIIYLAADHAGFELKEKLKSFLADLSYEIKDFGAYEFNSEDDYPDFIIPAVKALKNDLNEGIKSRAVIFGYSGQGEAITANHFKGVRAVVFYGGSEEIIKLSREHNNTNVLSLAARFISESEAMSAVRIWLDTPFPNSNDQNSFRHIRRIEKIDGISA